VSDEVPSTDSSYHLSVLIVDEVAHVPHDAHLAHQLGDDRVRPEVDVRVQKIPEFLDIVWVLVIFLGEG